LKIIYKLKSLLQFVNDNFIVVSKENISSSFVLIECDKTSKGQNVKIIIQTLESYNNNEA
jgi:hypothetical protein